MYVLHAHYDPENPAGVLFWAETSDVPIPKQRRNKTPQKSQSRLQREMEPSLRLWGNMLCFFFNDSGRRSERTWHT